VWTRYGGAASHRQSRSARTVAAAILILYLREKPRTTVFKSALFDSGGAHGGRRAPTTRASAITGCRSPTPTGFVSVPRIPGRERRNERLIPETPLWSRWWVRTLAILVVAKMARRCGRWMCRRQGFARLSN
jgi:hypothetical protein